MTEEKPKPPRLKGFALVLGSLINAVKDKPECKDLIRGMKTRVLFNNKEDKKWACMVTVVNDQIKVEAIRKEGKKSLTREKLRYYGYWEFSGLEEMAGAASWKSGKWIRKMARGTVKGASQISLIAQILALARPPAKAQ